jgi:hypothetical protein
LFTIINDIFFIFCVIRRIGRFLFRGLYGVGSRPVKVFAKNTLARNQKNKNKARERGRFFVKPEGLDLY